MSKKKQRISTEGGEGLNLDNPFANLSSSGLPEGDIKPKPTPSPIAPKTKKTRVELRRLKAGKGGKTVTEISGLHVLGEAGLNQMGKKLKVHAGPDHPHTGQNPQPLEIDVRKVEA